MFQQLKLICLLSLVCFATFSACEAPIKSPSDPRFAAFIADAKQDSLQFFWKDVNGSRYGSLGRLRGAVDSCGRRLRFAMNGGMYLPDHRPQGLYIENGAVLALLDTGSGFGNFYLKPNGVFSISRSGKAAITPTALFRLADSLLFATQSGPLLVLDGELHPAFRQGSQNLNIRNGVGVLPDGRLLFGISKVPVNFYDFAVWFRNAGCRDALYLDGLVSRAYIPEIKWEQLDGDFGVIIGVVGEKD